MAIIRNCPSCGKPNRIPAKHLADTGKCGACKAALPAMAEPVEVSPEEFDEIIRDSKVPVFVDFWAEWCGPCRMVGPVVEEIAKEYDGKAVVGKVNVDNNPGISMKFGIRNIPALLFFKNGEIVDKQIGAVPKSVLSGKLDKQLA